MSNTKTKTPPKSDRKKRKKRESDERKSDDSAEKKRRNKKSDAKKSATKSDAKKRATKSDAKKRATKSDAKKRATKSDATKSATKSDATKARPKSDGKASATKSKGKTKARRRPPPVAPRRSSPIPLVAAALLSGTLVGVGVYAGLGGATPQAGKSPGVAPVASSVEVAKASVDPKVALLAKAEAEAEKAALAKAEARKAKIRKLLEASKPKPKKKAEPKVTVRAAEDPSRPDKRYAGVDPDEEDYDYDADDDSELGGPEPIPQPPGTYGKAEPKPEPKPEPKAEPVDDAGDDDSEDLDDLRAGGKKQPADASEDDDGDAVDRASPVAEALREMLNGRHTLRKNGEFSVSYPMSEDAELEDFESQNLDKAQIGKVQGITHEQVSDAVLGLELGAGSQRMGRLKHVVPLDAGNFEINVSMWVNFSNKRSMVVFMVGKTFGVNLGQQIVKVSRSGRLRPLTPVLDRNAFNGERIVNVQITYVDGVLKAKCAGKQVAEKEIDVNDMRGHFGILVKDIRMQITDLSLSGTVDVAELR